MSLLASHFSWGPCIRLGWAVLCTVVEFSKKTGDHRELSRTDLLVVALAYMLEVETNGRDHLHTEPVAIPLSMLDIIDEGTESKSSKTPTPATTEVTETKEDRIPQPETTAVDEDDVDVVDDVKSDEEDGWTEVHHSTRDARNKKNKKNKRKNKPAGVDAVPVPVTTTPLTVTASDDTVDVTDRMLEGVSESKTCDGDSAVTTVTAVDDGCGEWIGPHSMLSGAGFDDTDNRNGVVRKRVGCVTTDFAMQVCLKL